MNVRYAKRLREAIHKWNLKGKEEDTKPRAPKIIKVPLTDRMPEKRAKSHPGLGATENDEKKDKQKEDKKEQEHNGANKEGNDNKLLIIWWPGAAGC